MRRDRASKPNPLSDVWMHEDTVNVLDDIKRYLWTGGSTSDDPRELLERVLVECQPNYCVRLEQVNKALKMRILDLEDVLQGASSQLLTTKAQVERLEGVVENLLQHHAECQTYPLGSQASMQKHLPSPETRSDRLMDPSFVPCRDERCQIEGLHREHKRSSNGRRRNHDDA